VNDVVAPESPVLATIAGVELIRCGTWEISTGTWTVETGDLEQAIAAMECPAVRRPILKLGHTDPRFDGEPAVGYIDNLALADEGQTLVGDYVGMPAWLADIAASAYPDRSIEGEYDYQCQVGHVHPFVLTAVAFLGVMAPGVGNLESLQDVAALYGVAAASSATSQPVVLVRSGGPMPAPVLATATVEDVRREFYDTAPWTQWICEVQLDPLQLIVCDDESGNLFRVTVAVDGDTVTFGAPVPVKRVYEDAPAPATPAAAAKSVVYATRAESRPGTAPTQTPSASADGPTEHNQEGTMSLSDEQFASLRTKLGVTDENADADTVLAALDEALAERTQDLPERPPVTAPVAAEGTAVIDAEQLQQLQVAAAAGQAARDQQLAQDRDRLLDDAIRAGKFSPARRQHYAAAWASDPEGTKETITKLSPGLVPVEASGYAGDTEAEDGGAEYAQLFGAQKEG
jgi:hypothetical protein